jgi:DNA repair exonuclease SbcCD ATPase subunit
MAGEKKTEPQVKDAAAYEEEIAGLKKENARLIQANELLGKDREKADATSEDLKKTVQKLESKITEDAADLEEAGMIIDELKAKIAGYEAQPETDGKGRKIHQLKGTKEKYQLVFATKLNGELVDDDAIVADNGKLADLVKMQSGAIRKVGE